MNINLAFITDWLREVIYIYGLGPAKTVLLWLPWPVVFFAVCLVAWRAGGWRIAAVALTGLLFIALTSMWTNTMVTISQVGGRPAALTGYGPAAWASWRQSTAALMPNCDRFSTLCRPCRPSSISRSSPCCLRLGGLAGIIATMIYTMPPAARLTSLGVRQVSFSIKEAAQSYGSTSN